MAVAALVLFAIMFVLVFVLRSVMQRRSTGDSGIRAGGLEASFGSIEWVAAWMLVLALVAAVAAPIADLAGLSPLTTNTWVRGTGAAMAVLGIALTFLAQLDMGSEWRIGLDPDERTGLVTEGAFTIVRNPIFSAMLVTGLGLALMVPNAVALLGFAGLVAAIELQVRFVEEPHLRQLHGRVYAAYADRVGRFVPGVG